MTDHEPSRTRRSTRTVRLVTVLAGAVALPVALSGPAQAGDDDVVRRGSCSGSTEWKMKAGPEDGRIEVESEIDSDRNGQKWRWRLRHDGTLSARGTATTKPPSGSFEIRRTVVDGSGTDRLVFRARNPRSGEVCRGVLRF